MSFYYPQAAALLRLLWENPQDKDPNRRNQHDIMVRPRSLTVNLNSYREADTFKLELDYKCFPFDPRLIRSLGISIYIQDMKKLYDENGELVTIKPTEKGADANVMFIGFADEESTTFDDGNRTVRLEGRDYTGLFLDFPFPQGSISLEKRLDQVIDDIVKSRVETREIEVVNRTGLVLSPLVKYFPDFAGTSLGGKKNVARGDTYWDVITDIAGRAGLIAYIELDKLILARPQNLYDGLKPYQFIYGKNLSKMTFERKLSRQKGFNVKVRSIYAEAATSEGKIIEAMVPREATLEWCSRIGLPFGKDAVIKKNVAGVAGSSQGAQPQEEMAPVLSFNVPNVRDKASLIAIAEGIYEELGRQQISGTLETKEMGILQRASADSDQFIEFDIRKIRTATPLKIELAEDELEQTKNIGGTTLDAEKRREAFLLERDYPPNVAAALAKLLGSYKTTFYTKEVEFNMGEEGFSMRAGFINFIDLKDQ